MTEHTNHTSSLLSAEQSAPKTDTKEPKSNQWLGWVLIVSVLAAAAFLVLAYGRFLPSMNDFLHNQLKFREAAAWGQLGDFMGGILNPLISICTLAVAVMVWNLQKAELFETRKAVEEQGKTAEQQRQEQRFFDLLNVYQRTVESISMTISKDMSYGSRNFLTSNGKQAISTWMDKFEESLKKHFQHMLYSKAQKGGVQDLWKQEDARGMFGHYLRVVFLILTESEVLLGDQHQRYVELFQAQFSRAESNLLGYSLWLDDEDQNMTSLAEKYHLLKHLPSGPLRTEMENLHPNMFRPKRAQSDQPLPPSESES